MSVGLMLVSHNDIGAQFCATASAILKHNMPAITPISIPSDLKPELVGSYADLIRDTIESLNSGDGVLVLTDIPGATPDNLARYFSNEGNAVVISGINLPMLLRVLNYAHQSIEQLSETAISGGKSGIRQDIE